MYHYRTKHCATKSRHTFTKKMRVIHPKATVDWQPTARFEGLVQVFQISRCEQHPEGTSASEVHFDVETG